MLLIPARRPPPIAAGECTADLISQATWPATPYDGQTIFIDGGADVVIRGDSVW